MKIALPKVVWEKLSKKTQKELTDVAKGTMFFKYISMYGVINMEGEIVVIDDYEKIGDFISAKLAEEKEKERVVELEKIAEEYNILKASISNIKEVLK